MQTQFIVDAISDSDSSEHEDALDRGEAIAFLNWKGVNFKLFRGENLVGRADKCDVRLNDTTVSDLHAEINISNDEVEVKDLRSRFFLFL